MALNGSLTVKNTYTPTTHDVMCGGDERVAVSQLSMSVNLSVDALPRNACAIFTLGRRKLKDKMNQTQSGRERDYVVSPLALYARKIRRRS
ncbi:MAG: hypothetical protein Q4G03_07890 [Planctomycetia bacterium]|nr:hypothetical protein [Planctomycetia bacterium]